MDLTDDQEIRLVLKTGQLQKQSNGDLYSDWEDVILIPEEELIRVKEAVSEAGEQKLLALKQLVNIERKILHEEWRHSCIKMTMKDLEEDLKDLETVKVISRKISKKISLNSQVNDDFFIRLYFFVIGEQDRSRVLWSLHKRSFEERGC